MQPLCVPGNLDSLDPVAEYILAAAAAAGLDKKASYKLRLAVDEIVTNIIVYGYKEVAGEVCVKTDLTDEALTIVVEDTAPAYDPMQAELPDPDLPFEDRKLGGWGVYFAFKNVDKFIYERIEGGNRNTFVVSRPRS